MTDRINWDAIVQPLDVSRFPKSEHHLRRWTGYERTETGVIFHCETAAGQAATFRVDVIAADVARIRMARAGQDEKRKTQNANAPSALLIRQEWPAAPFELAGCDDCVVLTTARLRLEFQQLPWQLRAYAVDDPLLAQPPDHATRTTHHAPRTTHHAPRTTHHAPRTTHHAPRPPFFSQRIDDRSYGPGYEVAPVGFEVGTDGRVTVREAVAVSPDEAFYGFGEKFTALDKWGQEITSWAVDCGNVSSGRSYKNVPFFISSAGYGIFVHSTYPIVYRMGSESSISYTFHVADDALDYFLIYGPAYASILTRYWELTGRAPTPPKWSFGFWLSRAGYRSRAEVEAAAAEMRARDLPLDVVSLDPWWMGEAPWCSYAWDAVAFPNPPEMLTDLRKQGVRTCLWIHPYVPAGTPLYAEGAREGYFVQQPDHGGVSPVTEAFSGSELAAIDFTNPAAVAWFQDKLAALLDMGVAVFKSDFGEQAPVDAVYHDGRSGLEMHNLYPLLYNRAVFELTERRFGRGLTWGRSGYAGSQRYPVQWGGDSYSSLDQMASQLRGLLSYGLSGVPFCSHDVGGFDYAPGYFDQVTDEDYLKSYAEASKDGYPKDPVVYARWLQFGVFSSHVRAHGKQPHEPWTYGAEVEAIARRYLKLRYRLLPYVYSEAVASTCTALPMARPLALAFQSDPNTRSLDLQYLFGGSILVAPVFRHDGRCRVYLPAGDWVDFWTKTVVTGPTWLDLTAPLDTLPLWVRGGAIIPLGPEQDFVDQKPLDPLTIELYAPGREGHYTIYDEDRPEIEIAYWRSALEGEGGTRGNLEELRIAIGPTPGQAELIWYGVQVRSAQVNGAVAPIVSGSSIRFDGRRGSSIVLTL